MTNEELENRLEKLVRIERRITREFLLLIREADKRRLHYERGFPNIYEWLVKRYGLSHGSAHRRIQAARLIEDVPSAMEKFDEGTVNLTQLAQVQSAIRREEIRTGEPVTAEEKEELVSKVQGKPKEAAEKVLAEKFPDSAKPKEALRARTAEESTLTITLKESGVEDLKRAREVLSHVFPSGSYGDIIAHVLHEWLKKTDPLKSAADKRRVRIFKRAGGQCEFVDRQFGRRCTAREHLEIDHIIPKSVGGSDEDENLRVLCRQHNLLEAERILGKEKIEPFRKFT